MRTKIAVKGIVQGVGFRPFIYLTAARNHLKGYVKNKGDAGVEILVEGKKEDIQSFLKELKNKKPPLAQIYEIITTKLRGKNEYEGFTIHKSSKETEHSGSAIPPDIAICDECLRELRRSEDARHDYFFITCTDCGPRYTIIERLPYDRENTTMQDFPMCSFCRSQYTNPLDRRFHAQTVACPTCGPKAYITDDRGIQIQHKNPIREAGKLLSEGKILAIKGYGGFHVATATTKDEPIAKLRQVKHRSQKPFAVMAPNLESIKTFAEVSKAEAELLSSYARPIVLLNKKADYYLSSLIAPDLHNVGVMLPYTGLHCMLFDSTDEPAIVMTSANPPNQPITKDNQEALETLRETVDYFLFHNRQIAHRCDDSVIRTHGDRKVFIRRSRGYAPAPIILKRKSRRCVLGLGGELNNTACILHENKVFISQHVGDVENIETKDFLTSTIRYLIHLTNSKVEAIGCDLHPRFTTTRLARELAEENDWELIQVQHHYAHIAALMTERGAEKMIGICCDGYGYGTDGEAWGGEILLCMQGQFGFKRLAHLEQQPLIGGDMATRYPLRIAAGMLSKTVDVEDWLFQNSQHFPHREREVRVFLDQLQKGNNTTYTTSCGRVMDAVAALLGLCFERTYEGEPAIKLESIATNGKDVLDLKPTSKNDSLDTTQLLAEIFEKRRRCSNADLAYSAHAYLAKGLAKLALEKALENNVKVIGFSGGSACNQILTLTIREAVEKANLQFLVHETIPPGDGGLSCGQTVAIAYSRF